MNDTNNNSRRKFLDKGLKVGLATVIGGVGLTKLSSKLLAKPDNDSKDTMELMTTDGTLIQVDSSEVMEMDHSKQEGDNYEMREGIPNRKFVMVTAVTIISNGLLAI